MSCRKVVLPLALALITAVPIVATAQTRQLLPPAGQRPAVVVPKCIDIEVSSLTAALVSTQANDPSVESPHDKVRVRAVLKNIGNLPVLAESNVRVWVKRNTEIAYDKEYFGILGAGGSSWELVVDDSFPHNLPTTYSVGVSLMGPAECSTENNKNTFAIDETRLHTTKPKAPPTRPGTHR
jgi:hypothetical protein